MSDVIVRFSEFLDPTTSQTAGNYTVAGFNVLQAKLNADNSSVDLSLDGQMNPGASYSVVVKDVTDLSGNPVSPNPPNPIPSRIN